MKRLFGLMIVGLVVGGGATVAVPTEAHAWFCRAVSPSAHGWGRGSLRYARRRALRECARRTPRRQTCYIQYCRR